MYEVIAFLKPGRTFRLAEQVGPIKGNYLGREVIYRKQLTKTGMIEILVLMVTAGIDNSKPAEPASNARRHRDFENWTENEVNQFLDDWMGRRE